MRLEQAFPSGVGSPRLSRILKPHWRRWPPLLKDTALMVWPALEPRPVARMPVLPPDLAELWNALSAERQREILGFLSSGDAAGGRRLLEGELLFDPPTMVHPPQDVRRRIEALAQRLWPKTGTRASGPMVSDPNEWRSPEETDQVHHASKDRARALEGISRTLRSIEQRLARGDLEKARRYLVELVEQQSAQDLPDVHVHLAKTLTKAATLAQNHGDLDWAEELYRQAVTKNRNDPVPANGLANLLAAAGDLDAAEAQYRDNIARWPGNEVAANGLAEVLEARGDLEGAEDRYRINMGLWPTSRVVRHGLANVLRKRGQTVEALALVPAPATLVTLQDTYDMHLRALLLMDLGRVEDARAALDAGIAAARTPAQREPFERSSLLLELRLKQYRSARERLASMPGNLLPLQLFRLHATAGDGDEGEARVLLQGLRGSIDRMSLERRVVLSRLEEGFCLVGSAGMCQPDDEDLDAIFDAEIDMELAA